MPTNTPLPGQIIEQLKANLTLAQVHAQAARIELGRKDDQIEAMAGEIERLRATVERHEATIRGLWAELAAGDDDGE